MAEIPIARGRVSHKVHEDLGALARACFSSLNDPQKISTAENAFAEYIGRSHCVVFPFARTAIHAILQTAKIERGDKVLLPPVTIKPILDVVLDFGLEPVFVDLDPVTLGFDFKGLEEALKLGPKVVILTYLFGLVPDCGKLVSLFRENNVFIIEDFSQCLNGEFAEKKIGTSGDVSVYSASAIKTLDTFGGGFAVLDDEAFSESLRLIQSRLDKPKRLDLVTKVITSLLRNIATQRWFFRWITWPILRLTRQHNPNKSPRFLGARGEEPLTRLPAIWFRKYTSVQANFLLQQLPQVKAKDNQRTGKISRLNSLGGWADKPVSHPKSTPVHWQHIVYAENPTEFIRRMANKGVDCTTTSLVQISNLRQYPYRAYTPNGDRLFRTGVYLPCYHQLTEREIDRIANALDEISLEG